MALGLGMSNATQVVINALFLPLAEIIYLAGVCTIFFVFSIITYIIFRQYLTETKDMEPEMILHNLIEKAKDGGLQAICGSHLLTDNMTLPSKQNRQ